ncbi:hypothetical protein, partial [Thiolapillus sp.]|uniref:hypothetical protein n=1 Tax=Thiolapillus sp. TaxID=2017437 RepID=UPI003AF7D633
TGYTVHGDSVCRAAAGQCCYYCEPFHFFASLWGYKKTAAYRLLCGGIFSRWLSVVFQRVFFACLFESF